MMISKLSNELRGMGFGPTPNPSTPSPPETSVATSAAKAPPQTSVAEKDVSPKTPLRLPSPMSVADLVSIFETPSSERVERTQRAAREIQRENERCEHERVQRELDLRSETGLSAPQPPSYLNSMLPSPLTLTHDNHERPLKVLVTGFNDWKGGQKSEK